MRLRSLTALLTSLAWPLGCADAPPEVRAAGVGACDASADPFGGGSGRSDDPFLLCTPAHLQRIADSPSLRYYRMTQDIDVTNASMQVIERFAGSLDGGGFAIVGLHADGTAGYEAFIDVQQGLVEHLRIVDANVVGAAGLARLNRGVIRDVSLSGSVAWDGTEPVGGLLATNEGLVASVRVEAVVSAHSHVGGVVGDNSALGTVADAHFDGEVTGGSLFAGGIAGANAGVIELVSSAGSVRMRPGVGRGAGGLVGWLDGWLARGVSTATVYAQDSAGGLVGRSRGGHLRQGAFRGSVLAEENAAGDVGLVEFGATFENSYAIGDVRASHSGALPFGSDCTHCFFSGTTADTFDGAQSLAFVSSPEGGGTVDTAALAAAQTFEGFDGAVWDLSEATLAQQGHPVLLFEASDASIELPALVPITLTLFDTGGRLPQRAVLRDAVSGLTRTSLVGRMAESGNGRLWAVTTVFAPGGEYTLALGDDDPAWGHWCTMTLGSPSHPWEYTSTIPVQVTDAPVELRPWVHCQDGRVAVHPGAGAYLSALAPGTVVFQDDAEQPNDNFVMGSLFSRVDQLTCVDPSATSGTHAWYFGKVSNCHFYETGTPNGGMTSRIISGVPPHARLRFRSYRDLGPWDRVSVDISRADSPSGEDWRTHWSRTEADPTSRTWESVEIPIATDWVGARIKIRFVARTQSAWESTDHVGWLVDDISIVSP